MWQFVINHLDSPFDQLSRELNVPRRHDDDATMALNDRGERIKFPAGVG